MGNIVWVQNARGGTDKFAEEKKPNYMLLMKVT